MLVNNRESFDKVIADMALGHSVVVDLETNGLYPYKDNQMIGIALYFPELNNSYYLPFRHGVGEPFDIADYDRLSNRTKNKQRAIARNLYDKMNYVYPDNLPIEYLDELREVWLLPDSHIFHNAKFDLHFLCKDNFPIPFRIEDTMVALHLVFEDWKGINLVAPYTNKQGLWETYKNGQLKVKEQKANRQLKWFCAYLQSKELIDNDVSATYGEEQLQNHIGDLSIEIANRFRVDSLLLDPKADMWMLQPFNVCEYAELDVVLTWKLLVWCYEQFEKWDNLELWDISCKILREVSFRMERNGIGLAVEQANLEVLKMNSRLETCQEIFETRVADHKISSPIRLKETLQGDILSSPSYVNILPSWVENVEGFQTYDVIRVKDTSKETLERYKDHPVIRLVQEYRRLKKATEYLNKWLSAVDDKGIVRNNMSMDGTVSGRFSSWGDSGNWQNIPDRNGYTIKRSIVPLKDEVIVAVDYGQLEARLACYVAEGLLVDEGVHDNPPTMTNLFMGMYDLDYLKAIKSDVNESIFTTSSGGVDVHSFTMELLSIRELLFKGLDSRQILLNRGYRLRDVEDYDKTVNELCRFYAKTLNFGLLYSGTKYMVAKQLKVDLSVAETLFNRWHNLFPSFSIAKDYYEQLSLQYRERPDGEGYSLYVTQPISNRHRKLKPYSSHTPVKKNGLTYYYDARKGKAKTVWNNIVQGLGGFLIPSALVSFGEKYGWEGIKPFALIHDAIELRVEVEHIDRVNILIREMLNFDVFPKLTVSVSIGNNWQDMDEVNAEGLKQWLQKNRV